MRYIIHEKRFQLTSSISIEKKNTQLSRMLVYYLDSIVQFIEYWVHSC